MHYARMSACVSNVLTPWGAQLSPCQQQPRGRQLLTAPPHCCSLQLHPTAALACALPCSQLPAAACFVPALLFALSLSLLLTPLCLKFLVQLHTEAMQLRSQLHSAPLPQGWLTSVLLLHGLWL